MRKLLMLLALLILVVNSCKKDRADLLDGDVASNNTTDSTFLEPYRPQFHFSPQANWMNDPNGLVHHKGVYHLFYQFYPDSTVWGPMHWGHTTSEDLLHWKHENVALAPDSLGYIFSGSAVVDKNNTSGFANDGKAPLVAVFTYHNEEKAKKGGNNFQTQGIAYSLDNGATWTKYVNNPVIDNSEYKDFRDPKVFWHAESEHWVMILVAGDHAKFYQSKDLKEWVLKSEFGKGQGNQEGVWECPDLFKLPVYGRDEEKWVLIISVNPGGPQGGSATQYFIGDFDGVNFTSSQENTQWLDLGKDNYAGITYNNEPTANRILIGWMSNWQYAQVVPTEKWRSAMTLPRSLKLFATDSSYYLKNYPLKNFDRLLLERETLVKLDLKEDLVIDSSDFSTVDIKFSYNIKDDLTVRFSNEKEEYVEFKMDPSKKNLIFNRDKSGLIDFHPEFASGDQIETYKPMDAVQELRFILDWSSIEIFVNEGEYVFTNTIFPTAPYSQLTISSKDHGTIHNFRISDVQRVWSNIAE